MPTPVIAAVSSFGIRRVLRSITVAARTPAATTTNAPLEIVGNALPEHRMNRVADRRHGAYRDNRDQRGQQAVLEQILSVLRSPEPHVRDSFENCDGHRLHLICSSLDVTHQSDTGRTAYASGPYRPMCSDYAASASSSAMLWKIVDTLPPAASTATMATRAISATSNAYSSRSWPSSLRANDLTY